MTSTVYHSMGLCNIDPEGIITAYGSWLTLMVIFVPLIITFLSIVGSPCYKGSLFCNINGFN